MTTQTKQLALHIISLGLMITTISLLYLISYTFTHWFFWTLGCLAFGLAWNKLTNYFINTNA